MARRRRACVISGEGKRVKCPNCGQEVVIATDLCPWCGYNYDFDGSISPRQEPEPRESGDPGSARERWTRAGVYSGRAKPAGADAERGLRWHRIVAGVLAPLAAVFYLYNGVSSLMSFSVTIPLSDYTWFIDSLVWVMFVASSAVYIVSGICMLLAMRMLKEFRRFGVILYLAAIIIPACAHLAYQVVWMSYFEYYGGAASLTLEFIFAILYSALTAVYYSRRRDMFR